ncbi:MAG: spermidine synthase [Elainellaceae cyanobacterium]
MSIPLEASFWLSEYITPWDLYAHGITRVLAQQKTPFQQMSIVESGAYGKALILDGKWQSCTGDEFLYHEGLVHPAMIMDRLGVPPNQPPNQPQDQPRRVLVLGGGEGATLREVLRWRSVEQVVMVDIDGAVVESCRQHLPEMHQGAFDDPRTTMVIEDAIAFVARWRESVSRAEAPLWDVIISDLSDPIESGPAFPLFTQEHFEDLKHILSPRGVLALQAGPTAPAEMHLHTRLVRTLSTVFSFTLPYTCYAMSFGSPLGFVLASMQPLSARPDCDAVDRLLASDVAGELRAVDGMALLGMLNIPRHLRRAIAAETQIYTMNAPPKPLGRGVMES